MSTRVKNKHGRTGVKKVRPVLPLDVAQKREAEAIGFAKGCAAGNKAALQVALVTVNAAKSIRAARTAIAKLLSE